MSDTEPGATYRCPTCGSENVDVSEFEDRTKMVAERVHISCEEPDCGWLHRSLMRDGSIVNNA